METVFKRAAIWGHLLIADGTETRENILMLTPTASFLIISSTFMFRRRSFDMVVRLKSRKYCLMKGIGH